MTLPAPAMPLDERQRAVVRVCLSPEADEGDLQALGSRDRWLIYRSLVRDRIEGMLRAGLPRTVETVGDASFKHAFAAWLAESPPRSPYIRHVVPEFLAHAAPRWRADASLRPWAADLACFETATWNVRFAEAQTAEVVAFDFERVPVLNPALELLHVAYPVHTKGTSFPEKPTWLCVYRPKDSFKAETWVLNDLAAALVRAWQSSDITVTESVKHVTAERSIAIDQPFLDKLSGMLASFLERTILLGSRG